MASYSSDFDFFCTQSQEELLTRWLSVRQQNRFHDRYECDYEVHILINGEDLKKIDCDEYARLKNIVDERFIAWSKKMNEEDTKEQLRKERQKKKQAHDEDLRTYNALKKKLGKEKTTEMARKMHYRDSFFKYLPICKLPSFGEDFLTDDAHKVTCKLCLQQLEADTGAL